ncbi:SDR family NAD(P)-dependent oxidoreductase [Nocardia puris]|uniref:type I polyketide synthase n=1 Tax=Nocardia puris TaxID=208602 RepID=UPI0018955979|nr:type I polyketide synthase [Nocardia puris]MBF6211177.1 SDR family NAD(P)-dependent oxidoreductase [Nocardia puris]MBF6364896.1 SDR family NAD(P)-dependent oxidoreductase [Nocardia puris]MBF6458682.1 SDR family NAD(P)-dependent oxidoreductase [Nocardia puris]
MSESESEARTFDTPGAPSDVPIAVIGLGALFPKAERLADYWANIVSGEDCITDVPADHWRIEDFYHPDPRAEDRTYSKRGGFIPTIPFDPMEFGIPPKTVEATSGLQLLSLLVAKQTLADAGIPDAGWFDPARSGVVLGTAGASPLARDMILRMQAPMLIEVLRSSGLSEDEAEAIAEKYKTAFAPWQENTFPGILGNVVAGRIANRFNFGALNCTTDAACASSLAAINLAISELALGRADFMLAGGCDLENSPIMYLCFSKTPALSAGGTIKPFDERNDGTLIGQGIGMLGLKRLADAERDGDRVYAVVKGMGSSSDGRFKSIYAPRLEGQVDAMERAYRAAGVAPETVRLIECHGTGTPIGDMVEVGALKELYSGREIDRQSIAIGTVKSQIGHTKCAAGAAGIIKAILALHHKVLPPTINVVTPNKQMGFDDSPFYPNTKARPWLVDPRVGVRRAGVSAFGFGGTNFHCVLEEAPRADRNDTRGWRRFVVHLWHAETPEELVVALDREPVRPMADDPVPGDHARAAIVAPHGAELAPLRQALIEHIGTDGYAELPDGVCYEPRARETGKIAGLFAGQGSQYTDMGAAAAMAFPAVRAALDAAAARFPGGEFHGTVYPPSAFDPATQAAQQSRLRATDFAQPAIGALAQGQFDQLRSLGLSIDGALGHSFGELTALWAAGSIDAEEFGALARARGRAMAECGTAEGDSGAMAAVNASADRVGEVLAEHPDVQICNVNAPKQVVVGGPTAAVEAFVGACGEAGIGARPLPVAAAFHTPLVAPAVSAFADAVAGVTIGEPGFPVYADTAGASYGADPAANAEVLTEQIVRPVAFADRLAEMHRDGFRVFVEFGPKSVLSGMVRDCLGDDAIALAVDGGPGGDGEFALLSAAARLAVLGVPLAGLNRGVDLGTGEPERSLSPATVWLNGAEYVPEHRRTAYRDALTNGYRIERSTTSMNTDDVQQPHPAQAEPVAHHAANGHAGNGHAGSIWDIAAQHLNMHREYLSNQLSVAERISDLLTHEAGNGARSEVIGGIDAIARHSQAISEGHVHASDVLRSFAELESGSGVRTPARPRPGDFDGRVLGGDGGRLEPFAPPRALTAPPATPPPATPPAAPEPAPAAPVAPQAAPEPAAVNGSAPAEVPAAAEIPTDPVVIGEMLIEVIADKTGYPPDMLELGMNMEADLGIDSIKRVEILSSVQERYPDITPPEPEKLFALATLQDVVDFIAEMARGGQPAEAIEVPAEVMSDPKADGGQEVVRRIVATTSLPAADALVDAYREHPVAVVAGARTALADALVATLTERGWTVARAGAEVAEDAQVDLALWVMPEDGDPADAERGLVDAAMFGAWFLRAAPEAGERRRAFLTVTRVDGALGMRDPSAAGAVAAGVTGLVKTIGFEAPHLFARAVDVAPDLDEAPACAALVAELTDSDHALLEVGIDAERTRRTVTASAAEPALADPAPESVALGADDVVVFTGGGRGVTAACARALAELSAVEVVLLGRTEQADDPGWADGVADGDLRAALVRELKSRDEPVRLREVDARVRELVAQREIRATLAALREVAERAHYLSVDVRDADAVARALDPFAGRIAGVVHGAGVLMDKHLVDKPAEDVRAVLAPKLGGIEAVLAAVDPARLRHLVLFTSVAGFYGNAGQADYAMANEALCRLGIRYAADHPDTAVTAVNWGPWEGGMVRPELAKLFRDRGVAMIPVAVGARCCAELFARTPGADVVHLVGPPEHAVRRPRVDLLGAGRVVRRQMAELYRSPVLADHQLAGHVVVPASYAAGGMLNAVAQVCGVWPRSWRNYSVLKGVIVDGSEPEVLELDIRRGADGAVGVVAREESGRPRYRLTVLDPREPVERPAPRALPPFGSGEPVTVYRDGTMFHGPAFRGLRRILRETETEIVLECLVPEPVRREPYFETDIFDPVLSDVALQVVGTWVRRKLGMSCLPSEVKWVDMFGRIPFDEPFVVFGHDFVRKSANTIEVSITVCDATGAVMCVVGRLVAIASEALNEVFAGGPMPGADGDAAARETSDVR